MFKQSLFSKKNQKDKRLSLFLMLHVNLNQPLQNPLAKRLWNFLLMEKNNWFYMSYVTFFFETLKSMSTYISITQFSSLICNCQQIICWGSQFCRNPYNTMWYAAKGHCNTENIGCRDGPCKGFGDRVDRLGIIGHGATCCWVLVSMSCNLGTSYPSSQDYDNRELYKF